MDKNIQIGQNWTKLDKQIRKLDKIGQKIGQIGQKLDKIGQNWTKITRYMRKDVSKTYSILIIQKLQTWKLDKNWTNWTKLDKNWTKIGQNYNF